MGPGESIVGDQEKRIAVFWEAVRTSPDREDRRVDCEEKEVEIESKVERAHLFIEIGQSGENFGGKVRAWVDKVETSNAVIYGARNFFGTLTLQDKPPAGVRPEKINDLMVVLAVISQEAVVTKVSLGGSFFDKNMDLAIIQGNVTADPASNPVRAMANILGIYDFAREQFGAIVAGPGDSAEQIEAKVDALIEQLGFKRALIREATNSETFSWKRVDELAKDKARLGGEAQPPIEELTPMEQMARIAENLDKLREAINTRREELEGIQQDANELAELVEEQMKMMVEEDKARQLAAVAKAAHEKVDLGGILTVEAGFESVNAFETLATNIEAVMDVWQIQGEAREKIVNAVRANQKLLVDMGDNTPGILQGIKVAVLATMERATGGKYKEIMGAIEAGLEGSDMVVRESETPPGAAVAAARESLEGLQKRLGGV